MASFNWPNVAATNNAVPTYANLASFPSASGQGAGSLGIALDTNNLYESNGTTWLLVGAANYWLPLAGGTMAGNVAMGGNKVTGLGAPSTNGDALRYDQLGANNGIATLDPSGKIPVGQLPSVVMEYQGAWNPTTNSPSLSDGTGSNGNVYYVSAAKSGAVSGLTDPSMTNFQIGDLVVYSSSVGKWQLVTPAAGVQSVNGAQGAVTVNAINQLTGDVTAGPASGSASAASSLVATSNATLTTLSALTTASALATVGTVTTGTWNATTVAVAHGGTGQTTQQAAIDALTGTQSAGKYVRSDGTHATLSSLAAADMTGTLGTGVGGTGVTSVTTSPTASSFAGWDANKNLSANNHLEGYATTATAAGTTTLTVGSAYQQYFTGTTTQTVALPVVSTLVLGQQFQIINLSTGNVTVQSSGGNTIQVMLPGTVLTVCCISTSGTGTASWSAVYGALYGVPGNTTGNAIAAGYVGESFEDTSSVLFTTTAGNVLSRTLQPGKWLIVASTGANSGAGSGVQLSISTTTGSVDLTYRSFGLLSSGGWGGCSTQRVVNISSATTYYIVGLSNGANITSAQTTVVEWIRIA